MVCERLCAQSGIELDRQAGERCRAGGGGIQARDGVKAGGGIEAGGERSSAQACAERVFNAVELMGAVRSAGWLLCFPSLVC